MKTVAVLKCQRFKDSGSEEQNQEVQNASSCMRMAIKKGKAWTSLRMKVKERL